MVVEKRRLEASGHLIDSGLMAEIMDAVIVGGGEFDIAEFTQGCNHNYRYVSGCGVVFQSPADFKPAHLRHHYVQQNKVWWGFPYNLHRFGAICIAAFWILRGLGGDRPPKFWSHVAHFGGAATAGVWILSERRRGVGGPVGGGFVAKVRKGQWDRKIKEREGSRREVDRILDKIHTRGIASLSAKEKRVLKNASEQQRAEDKRINKL